MQAAPRVAYCTDTYDEANGVATVSRAFAAYARHEGLPVLLIRPGAECRVRKDGSLTIVEVAKSAFCLPLDMGLRFDLLVSRQAPWLRQVLNEFHPDIVHITGPGDLGMVCARLSHTLRVPKPPLVAAWHTNVHQYAMHRAVWLERLLPHRLGCIASAKIESISLTLAARFYRSARLILAPNQQILKQLTAMTGKPGRLMPHGVDTQLFKPTADPRDAGFITLGYAGRLTEEKNVRFLVELAERLHPSIVNRIRFLIVGDGSQREWLRERLPESTRFAGVLRGQDLARAFASMDVFLFPSRTGTFGLVMLEAMASGVPVVGFEMAGSAPVVQHGHNGYAAASPEEFADALGRLVTDATLRKLLGDGARETALRASWNAVFASIYEGYATLIPSPRAEPAPQVTSPPNSCVPSPSSTCPSSPAPALPLNPS